MVRHSTCCRPAQLLGLIGSALSALLVGCQAARPPRVEAPPAVRVVVAVDGATAPELEERVATPLEQALFGLKGIASVRSESRAGQCVVTVTYRPGQDLYRAAQDVQEAVAVALQ